EPRIAANAVSSATGEEETRTFATKSLPEDLLPPPAAPEGIPGYEIVAELGRGGMGVGFKALQVKAKRPVALKMIRAGALADAEDLSRFRLEIEAIARLKHPHIVQIYDVGETSGTPFFAMEWCEGGSLAEALKQRTLSPSAAAALIEKLADAMHH